MLKLIDRFAVPVVFILIFLGAYSIYDKLSFEDSHKFEVRVSSGVSSRSYYTNVQPVYDEKTKKLTFQSQGIQIETNSPFVIEKRR